MWGSGSGGGGGGGCASGSGVMVVVVVMAVVVVMVMVVVVVSLTSHTPSRCYLHYLMPKNSQIRYFYFSHLANTGVASCRELAYSR